jgi:hypothetical protein
VATCHGTITVNAIVTGRTSAASSRVVRENLVYGRVGVNQLSGTTRSVTIALTGAARAYLILNPNRPSVVATVTSTYGPATRLVGRVSLLK